MAATFIRVLLLFSLPLWTSASFNPTHTPSLQEKKQLHIVYMGSLTKAPSTLEEAVHAHATFLSASLLKSKKEVESSLTISYHKSFNGFAAMLTPTEAEVLKGEPGVVSVFQSQKKKLLTTRSWDFVGLSLSSPRNPVAESEITIGMIDTGIWPENPMFHDAGFSPVPNNWKGACVVGQDFTTKNCNRKVIGAKYFLKGILAAGAPIDNTTDFISARDSEGHGSHTASTSGGSIVKGVNLYGLANGTARGGAPFARLAIYKVCWSYGCEDADILSAMDEAIHDGVNLLSMSLGGFAPSPYHEDVMAIGAYHAMQKGIVTACAAGNGGVGSPAVNIAPWIVTVAASSIDRQFYSPVTLGNNVTLMGTAINTFVLKNDWYPLTSGTLGAFDDTPDPLNSCLALDPNKVEGKIIICEAFGAPTDLYVLTANGSGLILSFSDDSVAFDFVVSTSLINETKAQQVYQYLNTTSDPLAKILPCEVSTKEIAPLVAFFSSRGPNIFTPSVMKPDISAPGVDIIAAWSRNASMTGYPSGYDNRFPEYNIISGTSMSTPHVAGTIAYVKSMHPDWSPATIKSALMTTAKPFDPTQERNSDLEFGYGAGQINPTKAIDPGLVYELNETDYVVFLCTHGYNSTTVSLITGDNITCPEDTIFPDGLNYPAIVGTFTLDLKNSWYNTTRTLTNVGSPYNMTYTASLEVPLGMEVTVEPTVLSFTAYNEQKSFDVAIRATSLGIEAKTTISTALVWTSGKYEVRTPVVAYLVSY